MFRRTPRARRRSSRSSTRSVASAIYFSLGVVAHAGARRSRRSSTCWPASSSCWRARPTSRAPRCTRTAAGATVFARYAFNELWSFVAGWVILLDYVILIAVTAFSATNYLAAFYAPLGHGPRRAAAVLRDHRLRRGPQRARLLQDARATGSRRWSSPTSALQALVIVARAVRLLPPRHDHRHDPPRRPRRRGADTVFALGVATVASPASSRRRGCRARSRSAGAGSSGCVGAAAIIVMVVYVGIGIVARHRAAGRRQRDLAGAQLPRRADARHRRVLPHRLGWPTR